MCDAEVDWCERDLNKGVEGVGFYSTDCDFVAKYIEDVGRFKNFLTDTVDVIFFLQLMNLIVLKDVGLKDYIAEER